MRLSIRENDSGYRKDAFNFNVFLDGNMLDRCFTADEEAGKAWCYKTDSKGRIVSVNGVIQEVVRTGKVEILHHQAEA